MHMFTLVELVLLRFERPIHSHCRSSVFVSCVLVLKKDQQPTPQQQRARVVSEDEAAGLRKQLLRFNCISCDRPIDVQPHLFVTVADVPLRLAFLRSPLTSVLSRQPPSLPASQGMRPIQSPRPYTTYELDQIRQYQKRFDSCTHRLVLSRSILFRCIFSQQFSNEFSGGGGISDVYATLRQCGGSHTTALPAKRQTRTQ